MHLFIISLVFVFCRFALLSCEPKLSVTLRLKLKREGEMGSAGFSPGPAWILNLTSAPPVVPATIHGSISTWPGCIRFSPSTFLQSHNSSTQQASTAFYTLYHIM